MHELFVSRSLLSVFVHRGISVPWYAASLARRANALSSPSEAYKNPCVSIASGCMVCEYLGLRGIAAVKTTAGHGLAQ